MPDEDANVLLGKVIKADYHNLTFRSHLDSILAGTFVNVPFGGGSSYLFGRVDAADAKPDHTLYRVTVLSLFELAGGSIRERAPERAAGIGADVVLSDARTAVTALGFGTDSDHALVVGDMRGLPAILHADSLNRHVFVGGVTGSGKSHFGCVLLEELSKLGIPAVVLDAQRDYMDTAVALNGTVVQPGIHFLVPLSSLSTEEAAFMVAALKGSPGYELFRFSFNHLRQAQRQKGFTLAQLLKQMEVDGMNALRMEGWDFRVAIARVNASIGRHHFIGTSNHGFNWINDLKRGRPVVVDCSGMTLLQLQLVATAVLRNVQRIRMDGAIPPCVVFLDEAHQLIPAEGDAPCAQVVRETIRMGRHWGTGVVLITQNPMEIDRRAVSQCNTRLLFALEPDQLEALRGVKADATPEMIDGIPKLPRGNGLLSGTQETVRHAVVVKIRQKTAIPTNHAAAGGR